MFFRYIFVECSCKNVLWIISKTFSTKVVACLLLKSLSWMENWSLWLKLFKYCNIVKINVVVYCQNGRVTRVIKKKKLRRPQNSKLSKNTRGKAAFKGLFKNSHLFQIFCSFHMWLSIMRYETNSGDNLIWTSVGVTKFKKLKFINRETYFSRSE